MKPTRRTVLASGVASAVASLLSRLPRSRPSPTGPVLRPEFGGPAIFAGSPWTCELRNVAGEAVGFEPGVIEQHEGRPRLVFNFPAGTVRGTVIEARVTNPLGASELRMFSPLFVGIGDTVTVLCPLRVDGSVA